MFCSPMKAYIVYIIIQTIIAVAIMGTDGVQIVGPALFAGALYLLCKYKHFKVANVLVALSITLGVIADIYALTHKKAIKHVLVAKASHRDNVRAN